jgi:6-pyruvoyltetrahydropterin/6-carboxytetrahydropterin synthase
LRREDVPVRLKAMRLGITEHIDCAHFLPGHAKCGQVHGHTYKVEVVVEGEPKDGMVLDFADLKAEVRAVLGRYDHRNWNDFLAFPSVENICALLQGELKGRLSLPFTIRICEGHGKWAEL